MRWVLCSTIAMAMTVSVLVVASIPARAAAKPTALPALFEQLDANGDGLLSRQEAAAVPSIADVYDSLDTRATIQQPSKNAHAAGITLQQFEAGMQAADTSGAFGPAASGGQTYLVYPDGSREPVPSPSDEAGS